MTQILSATKQGLVFEIISARISEQPAEKKHVIYTLQVRYISGSDDLTPSVIDRRYTQFENLYNGLRRDFPDFMADTQFPKKVLTGNFNNELISARSTAFESVLRHVGSESKIRTSKSMQIFLQEPELTEAKQLFEKQSCNILAFEKFQNVFKLLNKVFSDRSHAVLLTLCWIVACCEEYPKLAHAVRWSDLALYRFDGVSDTDLLQLYLPLLHACEKIYEENEKSTESILLQLDNMRRQGINDKGGKSLFEALNELEERILKQ
ncbi:sorting nexin-21 [Euwallacea similis]|uniref:sorting nexin-21 n=1 Tax=Euwallacea similis TaxID=1736056 RepID=UPI00344E56F2